MTRLDEMKLRRPDFFGGSAVILGDGQSWHLPRPTCYFAMDDDEAGVKRHWNLGPEYATIFDRCMEANDDETMISGELSLASFLLRRNYDLTPAQAGGLIRFGYGGTADPEAAAMREAIMAVATGRDSPPKPSGDGPG